MPEEIVSRILRLPGYGIYGWDTDEAANTLTLSIRQTAQEPYYVCGGCGISVREIHCWTERRLRDLPWGTWTVWLRVEGHRVRCRRCGVRTERVPFVEGKVHYTTRLEAAVAQDCEAAPVHRVAAQRGLPPETVRRMDKRVLRRWAAARPRPPLHSLGVDEIFLGKTEKFLTVVSDLETGEPVWVGLERKQETLDRFFAEALPPPRRRAVRAVCVDMWDPFRLSLQEHLPHARIVYDKFHVLRHASEAVDETRRAEFFRQGAELARQLLGALAAADQLNQPVAELRRIRSRCPGHWDLLPLLRGEVSTKPGQVQMMRCHSRASAEGDTLITSSAGSSGGQGQMRPPAWPHCGRSYPESRRREKSLGSAEYVLLTTIQTLQTPRLLTRALWVAMMLRAAGQAEMSVDAVPCCG